MNDTEMKFKEYIQSKGLKFTPERRAILNQIFENHGHFEADEMSFDLRKNKKKVSKATIYRTLASKFKRFCKEKGYNMSAIVEKVIRKELGNE